MSISTSGHWRGSVLFSSVIMKQLFDISTDPSTPRVQLPYSCGQTVTWLRDGPGTRRERMLSHSTRLNCRRLQTRKHTTQQREADLSHVPVLSESCKKKPDVL